MKFIRPVDLFDVARAIELYNQLEVEVKVLDQGIFDIHQGIRSSVRKEACTIAKVLVDDFDMEFVGLIDSMTEDQSLSVSFYQYDKDTQAKRNELEALEKKFSELLEDDSHKENARKLARVLKEIDSLEKDLVRYDFESFHHYLIFLEQYGHTEAVELWQKIQDKLNGVTSKRRDLQNAIGISLGTEHDALCHIENFKRDKEKLDALNKEAEDIRVSVSKTNSLRLKISTLSDVINDTKGDLLKKLTKQLEHDIPKLDLLELMEHCSPKLIISFRLYYVAINQLKFLEILMKYTYSQTILIDSERDLLQIIESKMTNREIVDLTRATRELLLSFVVYRPLIINFDATIRLKLINEIVTTVQKPKFPEDLLDNLKISIHALLEGNSISYLPSNLIFLLFQGALTESDIALIEKLPSGSIENIKSDIHDTLNSFDADWMAVANVPVDAFISYALSGLGTNYSLVEFKGHIQNQEFDEASSTWFLNTFDSTPSKVKECLKIE